jgi:signal transduction histidine kinase
MESRHVERTVIAAFAAVVLSFVGATCFSERQSGEIQRAALEIHGNAAPSIRHLTAAEAALRRLQLLVHRALEREAGSSKILEINAGRDLLQQELSAYQTLPTFPGEELAWKRAKEADDRFEANLSGIIAAIGDDDLPMALRLESRLDGSSEELARALSQDIEVNVAAAGRLAAVVQTSRRRGIILALALDGVGVLLAIAAAMWSLGVARAHARAVQACNDMAERRAEELDQFAGRMAHDVRTPLSVMGLSLATAQRFGGEDPRFHRAIKRAASGLQQANVIIEALLDFARAGARADPEASALPSEAAEGAAVSFCTRAEQVQADIMVHAASRARVACPPGLLENAVGNLVNNALTYVEGRDKRTITIATIDEGPAVKISVTDTGPGLSAGTDAAKIFEPHVRGTNARGRGLGLGLATVKKIVDAHGGGVGVSSTADGCVFWFTLPVVPGGTPEQEAHVSSGIVPS